MDAKHTAGPWQLSRDGMTIFAGTNGAGVLIRGVEQVIPHVAYIPRNGFAATTAEQQGNARLITTAPELLDSLKRIVCAVDYAGALMGELGREIIKDCYVTIAKAEGSDATFKEQHG